MVILVQTSFYINTSDRQETKAQKKEKDFIMFQATSLLTAKRVIAKVACNHKLIAHNHRLLLLPTSSSSSYGMSPFSSSSSNSSYHIEVSNLAKQDITQLVITGKGVPGLLASICVTLTMKGGDIKELHAAENVLKEDGRPLTLASDEIRDVIFVVHQKTGTAFPDDELYDLGQSILAATVSPMDVISIVKKELDNQFQLLQHQQATPTTNGSSSGLNGSSNATNTATNATGNDGVGMTMGGLGKVTVIPKGKFPAL